MGLPELINAMPLVVALYVGPDQVMPVMSILATVMGMLMIFWNKVMNIFRKLFGVKPPETTVPPMESHDSSSEPKPPQS